MPKLSDRFLILRIAFLAVGLLALCRSDYSGSYDVAVKQVLRCEDSGSGEINFTSTRLYKVSRSTYNYFTNFTSTLTIDDHISVETDFQSWGNGGWRPGFFTHDMPMICTGMKELIPLWYRLILSSTGRDACPIPPGTYSVQVRNMSFASFNVAAFPYGTYRMMNSFYEGKKLLGCIGLILDVTPKHRRPSKKRKVQKSSTPSPESS